MDASALGAVKLKKTGAPDNAAAKTAAVVSSSATQLLCATSEDYLRLMHESYMEEYWDVIKVQLNAISSLCI